MVPGFAFDGGAAGEFGELLGDSGDEGEFAFFGEDEEGVLRGEEEELALAIAAAFPFALAGGEVDAGEDTAVETVGVAFVDGEVVEVGFEAVGGPAFLDGPGRGAGFGGEAAEAAGFTDGEEDVAIGG